MQRKAGRRRSDSQIVDLTPRYLAPGEEAHATFEALHDALTSELAPTSKREIALARNIITLELEALRHRKEREDLTRSTYLEMAATAFRGENFGMQHSDRGPDAADAKATALLSRNTETRKGAERELVETGHDPSEILQHAARRIAPELKALNRKIAYLETRRGKLREAYEKLKAGVAQNSNERK